MQGAGCRVQGAGCMVQGAWCMVHGAGRREQGAGRSRVQGAAGNLRRIKLDPGFPLDECGGNLHDDSLDGVGRAPALQVRKCYGVSKYHGVIE